MIMKMKYQYIYFDLVEELPKTKRWWCRNNKTKSILGVVKWYSGWRQYCFFPEYGCVFNESCLDDISHFLNEAMLERGGGK